MTLAARVSSNSGVAGGYGAGRAGLRGPAVPSQGEVEGLKNRDGLHFDDAEYQFQFVEPKGEDRASRDKNSRRKPGFLFQTPSATFAAILSAIDEHDGARGGGLGAKTAAFGGILARAISAYEKTAHVISVAATGPTHSLRISL